MAHFAELDANNVVTRVIVVGNPDCLDETGQESEAVGIAFCQSLFGADTTWVQSSYNGNFRGKYAGISDYYDAELDQFVTPEPELARARNADGTFAADDPSTPGVDEAWAPAE
jgi:hypothetical protein